LVAKSFVDILVHEGSLTDSVEEEDVSKGEKEQGRGLVETDPLSPRMITWGRRSEEDYEEGRGEVP
jgi:hypothetical protein